MVYFIDDERERAARLSRWWNNLNQGAREEPGGVDPSLVATIHHLRLLDTADRPEGVVVRRATARYRGIAATPAVMPQVESLPSGGTRRRQAVVTAATIALLVVTLVAGTVAYRLRPSRLSARPSAQSAALAAQGIPELHLLLTDTSLNVPAVAPSGCFLITFANASSQPEEIILARLPPGLTAQTALATPGATALPWLLQATYPGSPGAAAPGTQTTALVDLAPGQYVAFTADEQLLYAVDHHRLMAGFVVGASPGTAASTAPPRIDGNFTLADDAIVPPPTIGPGPHLWRVVNTGQRTHELRLFKAPWPLTVSQVLAAIAATDPTQPVSAASGGLNVQTLMTLPPAGGLGWLSPGHTAWISVDLPPGTYLAIDLVRSPASGEPYALYGAATVLTIQPGGMPAA